MFGEGGEGGGHLFEIGDGLVLVYHLLAFYLVLEGAAVAELVDQVEVRGGLQHLDEFYYVGVVYL